MRAAFALAIFFAMGAMMQAKAATTWAEQQVSIDGGLAPLHGTLTIPSGSAPVDAMLILPGSGPTDRNGNFPGATNNSLLLLAHDLGANGIASLRIDKRGVGESAKAAPPEQDLRLTTYVDDAVKWATFLAAQKNIRRVFLLGHSEGALIATLAAEQKPVAGLVLIAGAGRPAPILLREQLAAIGPIGPLQEQAENILKKLEAGQTVADVPPELAALFRPSVQPYLISWFKYDPVRELSKLSIPTLIVQGSNDLQVSITDAQRLVSARQGINYLVVDNMNHVLKTAPADRAGNTRLYAVPDAPLAPGLSSGIAEFVRTH